jgi:hypothetical protein
MIVTHININIFHSPEANDDANEQKKKKKTMYPVHAIS